MGFQLKCLMKVGEDKKVVFEDGKGNSHVISVAEIMDIAANGPRETWGISIEPSEQMVEDAINKLNLRHS